MDIPLQAEVDWQVPTSWFDVVQLSPTLRGKSSGRLRATGSRDTESREMRAFILARLIACIW